MDDADGDVVEDDDDCLEDEFGLYSSPMGNRSGSSGHRAWRALGPVGAWAGAGTCKARPARSQTAGYREGTTVRGAESTIGPRSLPGHSTAVSQRLQPQRVPSSSSLLTLLLLFASSYHWQGLCLRCFGGVCRIHE